MYKLLCLHLHYSLLKTAYDLKYVHYKNNYLASPLIEGHVKSAESNN